MSTTYVYYLIEIKYIFFVTDHEILYRNENGDLILYDVNTDSPEILVANTSQVRCNLVLFTVVDWMSLRIRNQSPEVN